MGTGSLPIDWYRSSFIPNPQAILWEGEDAEEKVERAVSMLGLAGTERVLDLGCAVGQRSLALSRLGFRVIGVDPCGHLLEVGGCTAEIEDLWPYFIEADPRELEFNTEFDVVLSLGGGAFGYFDYDEDDLRIFKGVARALRSEGRLLMQIPNLLFVEAHLPERTWVRDGALIELVEQFWDGNTRRLNAEIRAILTEDPSEVAETVPFQRRLYTIEELATIFESVGMQLADVFDENGERCAPTEAQQEIYVEARKPKARRPKRNRHR